MKNKNIITFSIFCISIFLLSTCSKQIVTNGIISFTKNKSTSPEDRQYDFEYFSNGHLEDEKYKFRSVEHDGRFAGEIVRASDASSWSGIFTFLKKPIYLSDGKQFVVDVWMDHLGSFTLKLEDSPDGGQNTSISVQNTKINQWETLIIDFEDDIVDGPSYTKIAIFSDIHKKATGKDVYSYFSGIRQIPIDGGIEIYGDKNEAVKIVVLGSSTAAGSGPTNFRNTWVSRYRRKLQVKNGYHKVINLAVGGYTTYHLLPTETKVDSLKPQPSINHNVTKALSFNPDAVLINLPSNDANNGYTIKEQLDNYTAICKPLYDLGIPVWVSTPQGRNMEKKKRALQKVLRDSTNIRFGRKTLDFWRDMAHWDGTLIPKYDSGDGIHMNDEAHRLLFEEVWSKDVLGAILDKRKGIIRKDSAYTTPLYREGYVLKWQDEFNGTELDMDSWTHELGDGCPDLCGWGNREKVWYRPENSQVKDGKLIITAKPDKENEGFWSSSRIITHNKVDFRFGRIDVRAKLPKTKGLWPAIWLLGTNRFTVGWPNSGEIDIMEEVGHIPHRIRGTVFYTGSNNKANHIGDKYELKYGDFSDDFHVYSIDWDGKSIKYLVDDQLYTERKYSDLNIEGVDNPFIKPFYMILNCAVGGNLPGEPDHTSVFPQTFEIDYVRHFQASKLFYLPKLEDKVKVMPKKENLWIYLMAGQSNMEGQGVVGPLDTIPNPRILTMNKKGDWIVAKEPLGLHNTGHAGMDCGYSFAQNMLASVPDSITIAVIQTALGGSSVEQWLNDSEYRGMNLWSNMKYKIADGLKSGTFKGMIWHQGETDAKKEKLPHYKGKLNELFDRIRTETNNTNMPVVTGELGKFNSHRPLWIALNNILKEMDKESDIISHILTYDLDDYGDEVHFNTDAQRMMGKRYAVKMLEMQGYGKGDAFEKLKKVVKVKSVN